MTGHEEKLWIEGQRAGLVSVLSHCLTRLGYTPSKPSDEMVRLATEREEAISVLRRLCREHGDNDWDETLNLADIIEKHLGRHLS